jgi:hypothetical protein
MFEIAWAMTDVETAAALTRAAAKNDDELLAAQARIRAAEVALDVPTRLLRTFAGAGVLDRERLGELVASADLRGATELQTGIYRDLDVVARLITA